MPVRIAQQDEPRRLRHAVLEEQRSARNGDLGPVEGRNQRRQGVADRIGIVVEKERERRLGHARARVTRSGKVAVRLVAEIAHPRESGNRFGRFVGRGVIDHDRLNQHSAMR